MLIGDTHIDIGYLVMVIHFDGLSYQGITDTGALEEHDVILQSEGERTSAVHHGSQRNIGQREVGTNKPEDGTFFRVAHEGLRRCG